MRRTLFSLLVAAALFAEPSQSDRYKLAPLVSAAKLWNLIRYLDPRVTGDSTAWDAALVAALPKIEAAHSDADLATALDSMLLTLHDPCTRISLGLPGDDLTVQTLDSSVMVIHAGNGDLSSTMGAGLMLTMGIPQANDLVWDLRSSRLPFGGRPNPRDLPSNGLGYAFRQYSGYPSQQAKNDLQYSSSLQIVEAKNSVSQAPARSRVYLIDKDSAVPVEAIIEQIHSRSAIFSEDPPREIQAGVTELVNLLGKVQAEVRVAELYYPDGTTGFAPTRVILNRGEEAVKAAVDAIRNRGWNMPGERPEFELLPTGFRDMPYAQPSYPSREMRILAAFRMWGILHYFNPLVSRMGSRWDDVLVELLPKFSEAKDAKEYHLAMAEMAARTGDRSCFVSSNELDALFGTAAPPFEARLLGDQLVVTHVFKPGAVQAGDLIVKIGGDPVKVRLEKLSRYTLSPERFLLNGPAGTMKLTVRGKDEQEREISVPLEAPALRAHRSEARFRLINGKIGYADLERVDVSDLDALFEKFAQTSGIIFDLRGLPRDTAGRITARLGKRNRPVAIALERNLVGLATDGNHIGYLQSELSLPSDPRQRYTGKTVALIDGVSPGIAGESAMCFKAADDTALIGSTVYPSFSAYSTEFDVPGGALVHFGGERVRWPDGRVLKDGGVQPDIEVVPTVAGLLEGRDEVLDRAVAFLSQ